MSVKTHIATHTGTLNIGTIEIPCAVLEDGTRLLTQQGFLQAIGRARSAKGGQGASVDDLPAFLAASNLKPFMDNDLIASTTVVKFITATGQNAFGFKADLLPLSMTFRKTIFNNLSKSYIGY